MKFTGRVMNRGVRLLWLGLLITLAPSSASSQTYIVNTGPGGTSSIGAAAMFASGSANCSPQPECASAFQYLAARLELSEAVAISQIEVWVAPFSFGGSIDVKIREQVNDLPSTSAPPLFSSNSIYSKRYDNLPSIFGSAQWVPFPDYEAVLAAGTYWITFEPVHGSELNYTLPGGAAAPLSKYAFYGNDNPGYLALNRTLGVRVAGEVFPGVAFGTATRVAANSSFFGCCAISGDFVQEGTRDFTPFGNEGAPLTSSYIFHIGAASIHGRGKLTENGLSAGAYASTGSAVGAGRGVAFRTFINMSDQPRTFRVNANLHGAFFNGGGVARAGVYVFDTTLFSNTLLASPKTPGHFLLDADGINEIRNTLASISPARLFPSAALLASDVETPVFPIGTVMTVPMQTELVTLDPGATMTVLFDVAVQADQLGNVNFANTLSPAPVFLTDTDGNQVFDVLAVGPSGPPAAAPASVVVAPASASTQVGLERAVTATVLTADGNPVPDTDVVFTIASGPNAGSATSVTTDVNGEAVFTYVGTTLGTDTIQTSAGTLNGNSVTNTWIAGAVDRVVITPIAASIPVGTSQAFTVGAFDAFDNSLGDVTAQATFSITPDGLCTGAVCSANTPGLHTVTATYAGKSDSAALTFTEAGAYVFTGFFAPVDNLPVLNTMKAGSSVPVKFSLNGYHGLDIFAPGYPASQVIACGGGSMEAPVEQTMTSGASGLTYDPATDSYVYVWKTNKAWANTCRQLIVRLSDGSAHAANFKFR